MLRAVQAETFDSKSCWRPLVRRAWLELLRRLVGARLASVRCRRCVWLRDGAAVVLGPDI